MRTKQEKITVSLNDNAGSASKLEANQDEVVSTSSATCSNIDLAGLGTGELAYAGSQFSGFEGDEAGVSVAIGDVNGDSYGDILIGACKANNGYGASYLVLGSKNQSTNSLADAIVFSGSEAGGACLVAIGDVNKDGYGDILIGAPLANHYAGVAYLVLGSSNPVSLDLSSAIVFSGSGFEYAGSAVAIGDVNGDGYGDILIGATSHDDDYYVDGAAYLILGSSNPASLDLSSVIIFSGAGSYAEQAGSSVAIGDVNGDGYGDILIGAPAANGSGAAYLVLGNSNPESSSLASAITFSASGSGKYAGQALRVGDVNNDGYEDILIGAPDFGTEGAGAAYLVLGSNNPVSLDLSSVITFLGPGYEEAGSSVAIGDVNGDGYGDMLIGAPMYSTAYLVLGSKDPISLNLSSAITFSSSDGGYAGNAFAVGDVNGDGKKDLLIGAYQADGYNGIAYLVFGNTSPELNSSSNSTVYNQEMPYQVLNSDIQVIVNNTEVLSATIAITNNYQPAEDNLRATNVTASITVLPFDTSTGSLILTGLAPANEYQAALQQVVYFNNATNPNASLRTIVFQVNNGRLCGVSAPFEQSLMIEAASPSISLTPTATLTGTLSTTATPTVTPSASNSATPSITSTFTATPSSTVTTSQSQTLSRSQRATVTTTPTMTASSIFSPSASNSLTATVLPSVTLSATQLASTSPSLFPTATPSFSPSASPSQNTICTYTCYPAPSGSPSGSYYPLPPSNTTTLTLTPSRTVSITPTVTPTPPENSSSPLAPAMLALAVSAPAGSFFIFVFFCFCFYYRKRKDNLYASLLDNDRDEFNEDEDVEAYPLYDLSAQMNEENPLPVPGDLTLDELKRINSPKDWCAQGLRHLNKAPKENARYALAQRCFEEAAKLNSGEALYQLGNLCLDRHIAAASRLEQVEHALAFYQKGAELGYREASYAVVRSQLELAQLHQQADRLQAAYFQYEAAVEGGCLEAQEKLKQLLALCPTLPVSAEIQQQLKSHDYGMLAKAADERDDTNEAIAYLKKAEATDSYGRPLLHIAVLYQCRQTLMTLLEDNSINLAATDDANKTALDIALQQQDAYCIGPLQQEEHFQASQRKNEAYFQALIAQLHQSSPLEREADEEALLQEETEALYRRIQNMTEEDILAAAKASLTAYIKTLDPLTQSDAIQMLSRLIKRLVSPYHVLIKGVEKHEGVINSELLAEVESQLRSKVRLIEAATRALPHTIHQALDFTFVQIQTYYDDLNFAMDEAHTLKEKLRLFMPKVKIHGAQLQHRYLTIDAAKHLVVEESQAQRENQYGLHVVREYNGVHYKINPHAPGVEYMVNSLAQLLSGRVTPPTALLKVKHTRHAHVYLASKTVVGVNLEHILLNHLELIPKINKRNFAELFFLGVLVKPQDAKADNHMAKLILDEAGDIQEIKIVSIDNDIAFADTIIQQHQGSQANKHYINVKNIIYFLPQMDESIEPSFCQDFLALSPEVLVTLWLESLAEKNEEYAVLIEANVLDESQLHELQLPIKLVPGLAVKLYHTVKTLQDALRKAPTITYRKLLHHVEPILAPYYEEIQKHEPDAWRATALLYKVALAPSVEEALHLDPYLNSRHTLLRSLAYRNSDEEAFERNRTQTIQEAMEEWLSQVKLPEQEQSGQKSVVGYLEKLYLIEHLRLTNDSLLTRIHLSELVKKFPGLKQLTLRHCHRLTADALLITLFENPQLAVSIEECALLATAKDWLRFAERCKQLTLIIQGQAFSLGSESPEKLLKRYQESGLQSAPLKEFIEKLIAKAAGIASPEAQRVHRPYASPPLTAFFPKAAPASSVNSRRQLFSPASL